MPKTKADLPARNRKYWAEWNAACRALRQAGYTDADLAAERTDIHTRLFGSDLSSRDIIKSAKKLTAVIAEFQAISRPDDLDAQLRHQAALDDRQALIASIRNYGFADAYLDTIARRTFKLTPWTALPTANLHKLRYTVTTRARAQARQNTA